MSSTDVKAYRALEVMRLCHDFDLVMTDELLIMARECYSISCEYRLHVPQSEQHPYDPFPDGFKLSIDMLEVGLQFPLHPMIYACLKWWRISPSQMAPNSLCYMVALLRNTKGWGLSRP
ncbi:hypothetical protein B296_00013449 [Ensete ventricosum]|uniref:Uncharacterized protein n=1 Tax=Ensete ventricosum TaxID=4639 RepID=A0A427A4R9_ENSVE|nr:hypothetical protein B296_00013449 [Ensete ventricosum]